MKNYLKNQKGQAVMLTVIMLTTVMITSLVTAYVYTANRIRFYAQVKEAYKLVDATESAAKSVKSAWDNAYVKLAAGTAVCAPMPCTPDTMYTQIVAPLLPPGGLCFENPDNATPYCFSATAVGDDILFKLKNKYEDKELNRFQKFVAKMDGFFRSAPINSMKINEVHYFGNVAFAKPKLFNWALSEGQALAHSNPLPLLAAIEETPALATPGGVISVPSNVAPNCKINAGAPGCARCDSANTFPIGSGTQQSKCIQFGVCGPAWGCFASDPTLTINQNFRVPMQNDLF